MILEVVAGIIPNQPMPEHTRRFVYTSSMREADERWSAAHPEEPPGPHPEVHFQRLQNEAWDYALKLQHPSYLNWVRVDWIWI
jgi:hypothetical protein